MVTIVFFAVCTVLWRLARGGLVLVTTTIGGSRSHGHFCMVLLCHVDASAHDLSDDYHKRKLVKFHVKPDFRPYFNRGKVRCPILTAPLLNESKTVPILSLTIRPGLVTIVPT